MSKDNIWLKLGCDWIKVGDRIGWRLNNRWKEYSELLFSINSPTYRYITEYLSRGENS
ncbi:GUN4 domain-containing protein [Nostoc sp.]|uniref:GUN4 domain-containing protein n=1 Tax=Nostoc sp. TaxID=1180 RepID=UPI002FFA0086